MNKEINYKNFEDKLGTLYPFLNEDERERIIKQLFDLWREIIENSENLEN